MHDPERINFKSKEGCSKQTLSYTTNRFNSDSLKTITMKFQYVDLPNVFPRKSTSSASIFLLYFDNAVDQFVSLIISAGQLLLEVQATLI
ncbi:Oidioi.mRNA.OKI2018_I69.chr1.g2386.t1.cds [Oikopleura dioica]|uniref:Oidioi.mRNA.OKI2018_I69.chr1.g2386.t1.cds n=1 Tax=Oikopleura dioica TaxID=34765 RepID=A0ABN7SUU8_OIKDI|nr:Oidioi.mRNA.OKI2018_I69.chr1.g2386.t1.cds [Oikopleura dioica]